MQLIPRRCKRLRSYIKLNIKFHEYSSIFIAFDLASIATVILYLYMYEQQQEVLNLKLCGMVLFSCTRSSFNIFFIDFIVLTDA